MMIQKSGWKSFTGIRNDVLRSKLKESMITKELVFLEEYTFAISMVKYFVRDMLSGLPDSQVKGIYLM